MTGAGPALAEAGWPERGRPRFLLVLTHGAGGGPGTPDVRAVAAAGRRLGAVSVLVTQPYRVAGRRVPGPADKQDAAWIEAIAALRADIGEHAAAGRKRAGTGLPLIQGGRSNGARVACRTASAVGASAVIALAFPLHPPGRPDRSRAPELRGAGVDVLVVNGERDPFGIPDPQDAASVVVLPGETHALRRHPEEAASAVESWLRDRLAARVRANAASESRVRR